MDDELKCIACSRPVFKDEPLDVRYGNPHFTYGSGPKCIVCGASVGDYGKRCRRCAQRARPDREGATESV